MSTTTFLAQGIHGHQSDPDVVASLLMDFTELDAPVFYQAEFSPAADKTDDSDVDPTHTPTLLTFYRSLLNSLAQESVSWARLSRNAFGMSSAHRWPQTHLAYGYANAILERPAALLNLFDFEEDDTPDFPIVVENPRPDIQALVRAATNGMSSGIEILPEIDDDEWL